MKRLLPVIALGLLTLGGCANSDLYSGDVYRGSQAKTGQAVNYGTITAIRPVRIQADGQNTGAIGGIGGAVIGGLLGNQIGGGSGRTIATAVGALGGTVAGSKIENQVNQVEAWEIEVRRETGDSVIVVQKADRNWQVGQRVRLIGSGSNMSVAPY
ncbi:MAG: glycine zipper 2TM domain-containing protein [Halomonas sp.]|nr:glycine zipper 2TM domain-containing protein [Halomonas sp.]